MKLIDVLSFPEFYNSIKSESMSFALAYKLAKLSTKVDTEVAFYREHFRELLDEYGLKDESGNLQFSEDGQNIKLIEGKEDECVAKLTELQNLQIEIQPCLTVEELSAFSVTAEQIHRIMPFVIDEE